MGEQRRRTWTWRRERGGRFGCGCASFIVVITLGLVLSLFNVAISIGVSVGVPFTQANVTLAGAVGKKDKTTDVLPNYVHGRVGANQNFINQTNTLTIWVAEGAVVLIVGHQEGAPAVDLHLEAR
jgi:hypothetical protein